MKIAICFFGHLRTFKRCAPHLKRNLLDQYDCDLFMHTWSTLNHQTITHHENKNIDGIVTEQSIIDTYGTFKSILIEKQNVEDMGNVRITSTQRETSLFGIYSLYHSMKSSYSLCHEYSLKNNVCYDFIIMVRPDIALLEKLDINKYISYLTEDELERAYFTIVGNLATINNGFKYLGGNDLVYWGRPAVISSIMAGTDSILESLKTIREIYYPEHVLLNIVNQQGLTPYAIEYDNWEIVRYLSLKSKLNRIIRFKANKNYIKIQLFMYLLYKLFSIRFSIGNFEINICAGRPYSK